MNFPGKIAVLGGGTWATALAKIALVKTESINWFIRREENIEEFKKIGHNPSYLTNVSFDVSKINFSSDIQRIIEASDTFIVAIPSPFIKEVLKDLPQGALKDKFIISAVKGIIPPENYLITDYFQKAYDVPEDNIAIIGGPCHAEEIALERLTYPTVACTDIQKANALADLISNRFVKAASSNDVVGIETAAVLKNVYAIAAGICHGLMYGDNYHAVLISNAIEEMERFVNTLSVAPREIKGSEYLGDLLVTSYSMFSRNRTFGSMIGKGYSVKAAQVEMEMIAEGYYGTKCIYEMNKSIGVDLPIVDAVYSILYQGKTAKAVIKRLSENVLR